VSVSFEAEEQAKLFSPLNSVGGLKHPTQQINQRPRANSFLARSQLAANRVLYSVVGEAVSCDNEFGCDPDFPGVQLKTGGDRIRPEVGPIVVVDDCCPEHSGQVVKTGCKDYRVVVVTLQRIWEARKVRWQKRLTN
jgi:hypothetical protein